ncbi:phosphoribosylanthranilate isomerase [Nonomuraea sp. NPDC050663]|uniref:phosphoribosylanthranilate isomerase n=1 Tax=Nonomuraea sp. NPDC050663 TaxID=3364370 RepID=UPI0037B89316
MFVKICGLREPEHIEAAVEAGADAIGFMLTVSPRRVEPERAAELAALVPGHVLTVGVFHGESPDEVRQAARASGVRAIQLHGRHPHQDFIDLKDLGLPLLRAVPFDSDLRCGAFGEDMLLVDAPRAGSGEPWDWAAVRDRATGKWLLAGGLNPSNVAEAVAAARPWGADVSSGVEVSRGIKDGALIRAFVAAARGAA